MRKKQEKKKAELHRPPIRLETDNDWVRVSKKGEGALPSEDGTGTAVSTLSLSLCNRKASRAPRGERATKATIRIIADYFRRQKIPVTLENFVSLAGEETWNHSNEIFYSRNGPKPPLQFTGVDLGKQVIKAQRTDNPDDEVEIGFDTIERYLRDIRKSSF